MQNQIKKIEKLMKKKKKLQKNMKKKISNEKCRLGTNVQRARSIGVSQ